ncbi:hypothetical protein ACIQUQ_26905 [Streptomyces sp. NPDC101118]|uniref:hypothetical protein n=1 Tax=Streptomyces sp. NPDC101118 TaxID=3366109 RepID=UPI0038254E28
MTERQARDAEADGTDAGGAEQKRLDLSVAQVAGSSLATIAAAYLASKMGVYGTILGAGVVSVVATAGGPVIQHLFKRTGETLRETGEAARPRARQVPVAEPRPGAVVPEADGDARTRLMPAADPAGAPPRHDRTMVLGAVEPPDATRAVDAVPPGPGPSPGPPADFGTATTHGTRVRGWKAKAVAAALVFGVSMGGIAAYELVSGNTSAFGGVTTGGTQSRQHRTTPEDEPSGNGREEPGTTHSGTPAPDPSGPGSATPDPSGTPTPSHSADPTPEPTPPTPTPTPPEPTPTPSPEKPTGSGSGPGSGTGTADGGTAPTAAADAQDGGN